MHSKRTVSPCETTFHSDNLTVEKKPAPSLITRLAGYDIGRKSCNIRGNIRDILIRAYEEPHIY